MIINLDLNGKTILVLGAGEQAERRIGSLLKDDDGCGKIVVLSEHVCSERIREWSEKGAVVLYDGCRVDDASFLDMHRPDVLIAATDDAQTNDMAVSAARQEGVLAYRSDSAASADYSYPALLRLDGGITVAIFTGGRSPAVAKYVRQAAEPVLRGIVTPDVVARLHVQDAVRRAAKSAISGQAERKRLLDDVMSDTVIDRLIRDGRIMDAQERAMAMLGDRS